jgi:hypothetical protein
VRVGPALQRFLEKTQNGKANGLFLVESAIDALREAAEQFDCEAEL